jgi:formate dehydrogenase
VDRPAVIAIVPEAASRQRKREAPAGRRVDPQALADVLALLGDAPRTRDLLIEHLHKLQDRFGHLSAAHLAALAQEMRSRRPRCSRSRPSITTSTSSRKATPCRRAHGARLRRPVVRDRRRAATARDAAALLGRDVRVHRGAVHRPLRAGAGGGRRPEPVPRADCDASSRPSPRRRRATSRRLHRPRRVPADGGYALLRQCIGGERDVESSSRRSRTRACAASAARAFRPAASGASSAASRRRA